MEALGKFETVLDVMLTKAWETGNVIQSITSGMWETRFLLSAAPMARVENGLVEEVEQELCMGHFIRPTADTR